MHHCIHHVVDRHGYSGWTGWQVKCVSSPHNSPSSSNPFLTHCSDWPGLNCWMHPKEEGSPSGPADNECPLSILESEHHRERDRQKERERSYTVLSHILWHYGNAPPPSLSFSFVSALSLSLSPFSPITSLSISRLPTHIHIHMGLNSLTVCCTGPDIHPYIQTVTFRRLKASPPGV